jgi:hypothetical protein
LNWNQNKNSKEFSIFKRPSGQNFVCPTSAQHALGLRGPATELDGLARRGPRCVEPAHRPLPTPALGAHRACDNDGACMQSGLRSTTEGKQLRHEPRQGLHHEHPRRTANPPDMARRADDEKAEAHRCGFSAGDHRQERSDLS